MTLKDTDAIKKRIIESPDYDKLEAEYYLNVIDCAPAVKMLGRVKSNGEIEFISPYEYEREEFEKLYAEIKELAKRPQGE